MCKRILFACNQVPYYGGANTTFYLLFKALQSRDWDVHYLNLIDFQRMGFYKDVFNSDFGNPSNLLNVHNVLIKDDKVSNELKKILDDINPDLILAKNFTAPNLLKNVNRDVNMWFFPSQSDQIRNSIYNRILSSEEEALHIINEGKHDIPITWIPEQEVVKHSDYILCNSKSTQSWFRYFYPEMKYKISEEILWTANLIYRELVDHFSHAQRFEDRSIDVLFIANRWDRMEKNFNMASDIMNRLNYKTNIHIVGQCDINSNGIYVHQFLHYKKVLELMKNTKTVVSTSIYDPAPNVLYEASVLGCNVVASKNCGNWELCNQTLLVEDYNIESYIDKIKISLEKRYDNNINLFLKTDIVDQVSQIINEKQ